MKHQTNLMNKSISFMGLFLIMASLCACAGIKTNNDESESLLNGFPKGWVVGYEAYPSYGDIIEYVPEGETVEDWSQMMTVQSFKNAAGANTQDYLRTIANNAKSACVDTEFFLKDVKSNENGYETSHGLLYCSINKKTGKGEVTMFKVISGHAALYVAQMAARTAPFDVNVGPKNVDFKFWEDELKTVRVCHELKCF